MTAWRLLVAVGLLLLVGVPLVLPLLELAGQPAAWQAWESAARLSELARNSALLLGGVIVSLVMTRKVDGKIEGTAD